MNRLLLILFIATVFVASNEAMASGAYAGRPPSPAGKIDAKKYQLGKQVFSGTVSGTGTSASDQSAKLDTLQSALPDSAKGSVNLVGMAGKMSNEELDGLEYFLQIRYKIKSNS